MSLKLISVNVERSKHLEKVLPFIQQEQPDVLCIQELVERDIPAFKQAISAASHIYAPVSLHPAEIEPALEGVAILSKSSIGSSAIEYYRGSLESIRPMRLSDTGNPTDPVQDMSCPLVTAQVEHEGQVFMIGTTHFTWSAGGLPTDAQRTDLKALLLMLGLIPEIVICGDFNAPRGGEIFAELASRYTDNIPPHYETSIDVSLHRAGHLKEERMDQKMVDGLFSTPGYHCTDVHFVNGVSDHMAIVANIEKVTTVS